jgi:hypothetical protein
MLSSFKTLADLFTSTAHHAGETFPFVTIDDFEVFAAETRDLSKAASLSFMPFLINSTTVTAWNAYSANHSEWIAQSLAFHNDEAQAGVSATEEKALREEFHGFVYKYDSARLHVPVEGEGPFAPIWQRSPISVNTTRLINLDLTSLPVYNELITFVSTTRMPILSAPKDPKIFGSLVQSKDGSPFSIIMQPVFDAFDHEGQKNHVVGAVSGALPWSAVFSNVSRILDDVEGIKQPSQRVTSSHCRFTLS